MARGDRIATERRFAGSTVGYTHHGVDLGDGTVVHARPDDPERIFDGGSVARTSLAEFAAGAPVRIVTDPPPRYGPDEIAERALSLVGRDGYCPVVENCEHFATWCATGERASRQVDLLAERIGREIAHVPAFNESISTVNGQPHGNILYSWNSGYWWLRKEIRRRLGQTGPDPVDAAVDAKLGVVRDGGILRLEPVVAKAAP